MAKGQMRRQQRGQEAKVGQAEEFGVRVQEVAGGDGPGAKPAGKEILNQQNRALAVNGQAAPNR